MTYIIHLGDAAARESGLAGRMRARYTDFRALMKYGRGLSSTTPPPRADFHSLPCFLAAFTSIIIIIIIIIIVYNFQLACLCYRHSAFDGGVADMSSQENNNNNNNNKIARVLVFRAAPWLEKSLNTGNFRIVYFRLHYFFYFFFICLLLRHLGMFCFLSL